MKARSSAAAVRPPETSEERSGILLTYQPVYASDRRVAAYQVLFDRNGCDDARIIQDLSSPLVLDTYADVYQHGKLETVPHFLPVASTWLQDSCILSLPRTQYILEFTASGSMPGKLPEHLRALTQRGYRLALAGYRRERETWAPLLDIVDYVRLDLERMGFTELASTARELYFHNVKLLVEGVNDTSQYHACASLGITHFQGEFFRQPSGRKHKRLPGNAMVPLELLAELNNPDTSPEALQAILVKDARLSYRILKVINSAAAGLKRQIDSLADAIALLGTNELERWASLLLMQGDANTPDELTRSALIRGHMCEDIARMSGQEGIAPFFLVGLLSQLDALMDISMTELMQQVPLRVEVKQALLHRAGMPGRILCEIENFLDGHFDRLQGLVDPYMYTVSYQHSVAWARDLQQVLGTD